MRVTAADRGDGAAPPARSGRSYLNGFAKSRMIAMTSV